MRRVAEIIYVVEKEREEFLKGALNPDLEAQRVLWLCGVRKQQYFALNDLIFMTFEYKGDHFEEDMAKMAAYLDSRGLLVNKRRKDVPLEERSTTNWWAPVKKLGDVLSSKPDFGDEEENPTPDDIMAQLDGYMPAKNTMSDISYDADEWMESVHIW